MLVNLFLRQLRGMLLEKACLRIVATQAEVMPAYLNDLYKSVVTLWCARDEVHDIESWNAF